MIPTFGAISPQGRDVDGTGVPTWVDHTIWPVPAARAYTVSFCVATYTRPPSSRGSPKSWPSSCGDVQARAAEVKVVPDLSTPDPDESPWYTVQESLPAAAVRLTVVCGWTRVSRGSALPR